MHANHLHSVVGCRKRLARRKLRWRCPIRRDNRESRSFSACSVAFSSRPSVTWRTTSMPCTRAFTSTSRCHLSNPLEPLKFQTRSLARSGATCANTASTLLAPCAYTSFETTGTIPRSIVARSATSPSCCPSSWGSTCRSDITCRSRPLPGRASSLLFTLRNSNNLPLPRLREPSSTRGEPSTCPWIPPPNRNRPRTSNGWRSSREIFHNPPVPRRFCLPARPAFRFTTVSRAKASDLIFSIGSKGTCSLFRIDDCKYRGFSGLIGYEYVEVAMHAWIWQPWKTF